MGIWKCRRSRRGYSDEFRCVWVVEINRIVYCGVYSLCGIKMFDYDSLSGGRGRRVESGIGFLRSLGSS